ncbi:MAG: hypothetical protein LQ338_006088 [Usnochroma carphineum]|nr:MAG: hypothetical protein LQ338_006088 [Usnochroma carphineum]
MEGKKQTSQLHTELIPIDVEKVGDFVFKESEKGFLGDWSIELSEASHDAANLLKAVKRLQSSSLPVAFPTETVYGLGADATRSDAVAGIYRAKQRPADNPLIVHISSLAQLRQLLTSSPAPKSTYTNGITQDPIPTIYHPLISRFWPGPLTILLPLPQPSPLAPSVTGSLSTFGVRMPSSRLALALIHLAGLPIAAPSANVSTRPSPTTAAHVLQDLSGRIELIVDGGPCEVGVESTVVDGLVKPPVILRPGGVSIEMLRQCPGWERVEIGYRDRTETGVPRAPGMKYKHYSPTARVILVHSQLNMELLKKHSGHVKTVGVATSKTWRDEDLAASGKTTTAHPLSTTQATLRRLTIPKETAIASYSKPNTSGPRQNLLADQPLRNGENQDSDSVDIVFTDLGTDPPTIAQRLFSALRELDKQGVDVMFVEAIDATEGHAAAAVMNRLRKAAELEIYP